MFNRVTYNYINYLLKVPTTLRRRYIANNKCCSNSKGEKEIVYLLFLILLNNVCVYP